MNYSQTSSISSLLGESNDCSVKAIALTCGVQYVKAHEQLKMLGRKNNHGMRNEAIVVSAEKLGMHTLEIPAEYFTSRYNSRRKQQNVTTHHPARFNDVWADEVNYLIFSKGHVSAVIDGKLEDWAEGRSLRAIRIVAILPTKEAKEELSNTVFRQTRYL